MSRSFEALKWQTSLLSSITMHSLIRPRVSRAYRNAHTKPHLPWCWLHVSCLHVKILLFNCTWWVTKCCTCRGSSRKCNCHTSSWPINVWLLIFTAINRCLIGDASRLDRLPHEGVAFQFLLDPPFSPLHNYRCWQEAGDSMPDYCCASMYVRNDLGLEPDHIRDFLV